MSSQAEQNVPNLPNVPNLTKGAMGTTQADCIVAAQHSHTKDDDTNQDDDTSNDTATTHSIDEREIEEKIPLGVAGTTQADFIIATQHSLEKKEEAENSTCNDLNLKNFEEDIPTGISPTTRADYLVAAQHESQGGFAEEKLSKDQRLTQVLQKLEPNNLTGDMSVGDIMSSLDSRGFGPLLFGPALIAVMPTGGIPGVPTVCGTTIALVSVQMLMGRKHPWFPQFIYDISFGKDKLKKGVDFASKITKLIDKVTHPRVKVFSSEASEKFIALICIISGLSMMPLEVVPFAVFIPAIAVMLLSVGLITKDGYIIIVGLLLNLLTLYFIFTRVIDM